MTLRKAIPVILLFAAASLTWAQQAPPTQPQSVPAGNLSLQHAPLAEVIDKLARTLKINYILDPRVKGEVTLNTYDDAGKMDARNTLETILRINNARMVQEGDLFRIVPLNEVSKLNGPALGADMGVARACVAGDSSPAGTIFSGYRKVISQGLMGQSCHWEPLNK